MSLRRAVLDTLRDRFLPISEEQEYEFDLLDEPIRAKCPYRAIYIAVQKNLIDVDDILGEFTTKRKQAAYYADDIIDFIHGGLVSR